MSTEEFINPDEKIIEADVEKEIKKKFLAYSMSVIVARALPDVRDGLKPVHRRILYSMNDVGLTHDKDYRKSATIVGEVLGHYHPHGDASVYDAMVRLAQKFSMRYPLVDGQGNFGTVDGDPPAAYRYTEARMTRISDMMLADIDKNTVPFVANFDETTTEPEVLPARFPNLLVNGSTGIAVGMATNIPPHNLREVIDGIYYLMENPGCSALDLMEYIKGPDFPTGGIIMGRSGIRSAYATGRGKITLRGRAEIEEMGKGRYRIAITEIPYMVNKARLHEYIADLVKDGRLEGITGLRDESDRDGMRLVCELGRDANPQIMLNKLYQYTQLQNTVGVTMLALVNGEPKVMDLKTILEEYLNFQRVVIRRRTEFDLLKAMDRAHILEGLRKAVDILDEIIATIRTCRGGRAEAKQAVMDKFGFDDPQANAICSFQLGQLAGLEILKIEKELEDLNNKITNYNDILSNDAHILRIVHEELEDIRTKFGDDRKTEIAVVSGEVDIEDLIPEEDCVITLTHSGYIKRQAVNVFKSQRRGGRGITGTTSREEDYVEHLFTCSSHDYMLFLTTMGRMYRLKSFEIQEGSRTSRGVNIVNILPLMPDEKISAVLCVPDYDKVNHIIMVTRKGIIKKTELSAFDNIRKTGIIAVVLDEGDELAWAKLTNGEDDLLVATRKGMAIRISEQDIRVTGRSSRGVKAINLDEDDEVIGLCVISEGEYVLTVSSDGKGRRTPVSQYRTQTRGGKGSRNYDCKRGTEVASVVAVNKGIDAVIVSESGIIIRLHTEDVAVQSRYGSGVRVMKLAEDDRVMSLSPTWRENEDDTEENLEQEYYEESGEYEESTDFEPEDEELSDKESDESDDLENIEE